MLQKIIQVGNSLAVTIPKDFAQAARFRRGEEVAVETDVVSKIFLIKPKQLAEKTSLTPEFFEWLNEMTSKYRKAIIELAHK